MKQMVTYAGLILSLLGWAGTGIGWYIDSQVTAKDQKRQLQMLWRYAEATEKVVFAQTGGWVEMKEKLWQEKP